MSLSIEKIDCVKVVDTRLDLNVRPKFAVLSGGAKHSFQQYAPSAFSPTQLAFNITTPSPNVVVSRRMLLKTDISLVITMPTANVAASSPAIGSRDAARSFPVASCTNQLTMSINNTAMSIPLRDVFGAMKWIQGDQLEDFCDESPSFFDNVQEYSSWVGSNRNPLGGAYTSNEKYQRGAFPYTVSAGVVSGSNTLYTITFTVVEPIFISPLQWAHTSQGLTGVSTMSLQFNLGDVSRMWSTATAIGAAGYTSVAASGNLFSNTTLNIEYITPPITEPVPKSVSLPYHEVVPYISTQSTLAPLPAGSTATLQGQSVQLSSIPQYALIYARRSNGEEAAAAPDAFLSMRKIDITFNNDNGILSTAQPQHPYEISRKNGVSQRCLEWYGQGTASLAANVNTAIGLVGSVCLLEFGTDIPLDAGLSPGVAGTFQFSMKADFANTGANAVATPTMYVVFINEGVLTVGEGRAYAQMGVVSQSDVLDSKTSSISQQDISSLGGNFYNSASEKTSRLLRQSAPRGKGLVYEKGDDGRLGGAVLAQSALKARLK